MKGASVARFEGLWAAWHMARNITNLPALFKSRCPFQTSFPHTAFHTDHGAPSAKKRERERGEWGNMARNITNIPALFKSRCPLDHSGSHKAAPFSLKGGFLPHGGL